MKRALLFGFLFAVLFSANSFATGLGLRSDSLIVGIDFEPGFEGTYYYSLLVYGSEKRDVQLYATDDSSDGTESKLAKYFTFDKSIIKDVGPGQIPTFSVKVKLPKKIDEPGTHKVHVGAVEMFGKTGGMGAKTAIEAIFFVNVLHSGQYLSYSIEAYDVNQGEQIPVEVHVSNLGTDEISSLYADIKLLDFNKKHIAEAKTESISLAKRAAKTLKAEFSSSGLAPGTYFINATIHYDGKEESAGKYVRVGELNLKIINQTEEIIAGKINEIEVIVESMWADTLKDVYAKMTIGSNNPVRSLPEIIKGFEKAKLKAFFDAKEMKPGIYDMQSKVYFEDKTISRTTKIKVINEKRAPFANLSMANILFLTAILIVIIINITLFIILMKKKEEHEKER